MKRPLGLRLALAFLVSWAALATLAPVLAPYLPMERVGPLDKGLLPSAAHLLGTDAEGCDLLSRVLHGARISLGVGLASVGLATVIGVLVGAGAGLLGGWAERALMGLADLFLALPRLLVLLVVVGLYGGREPVGLWAVVLVLGFTGWMELARVLRGEAASLARRDFVLAARLQGLGPVSILRQHLLPHLAGLVLVFACLATARIILLESTLSFLGVGLREYSWGNLVWRASRAALQPGAPLQHWFAVLIPAALVAMTVVSLSELGEGLRRSRDPGRADRR